MARVVVPATVISTLDDYYILNESEKNIPRPKCSLSAFGPIIVPATAISILNVYYILNMEYNTLVSILDMIEIEKKKYAQTMATQISSRHPFPVVSS